MSTDFSNLPTLQHSISLDDAAAMTARYRQNKTLILQPGYDPSILALCETFNKIPIVALAGNPACVGIRIYYGMDENLLCHAILCGVDVNGADILPPSTPAVAKAVRPLDGGDDDILEDSIRCPSLCPPPSDLNE